jgi:predicted ATP-binding protein involved in virulence
MWKPEEIYIEKIVLSDYKCFQGNHVFSFVDGNGDWCKWTVFLGDNNTGKTNLLKAMARLQDTTLSDDCRRLENHSIYGYGVVRNIERAGINTKVTYSEPNFENLFYNTKLINFEDWLLQLDYAANNRSSPNQRKAKHRRDLLVNIIKGKIFPDILDIEFVSNEKLENYVMYQTSDDRYNISDLGYGYHATLAWLVDFCKKLFDRYPGSENPLEEPAVLFLDEIDLHLHPQWQRSIATYLSEIFTKTQFIVTTHSPFVVQSMKEVNLYVLRKEGDHTNVEHLGVNSYIGWRIEEILGEIMGLNQNGRLNSDTYNNLMAQFDKALFNEDYKKGKEAYDKLMNILHPQSEERKLLDIQFSQLLPDD